MKANTSPIVSIKDMGAQVPPACTMISLAAPHNSKRLPQ